MSESTTPKVDTEQKQESQEVRAKDLEGKLDLIDIRGLFDYIRHPVRLFFLNLLVGMARGLGFAIGMTILAALILFLLRRIVDVPFLGKFIAQILEVVEQHRSLYR